MNIADKIINKYMSDLVNSDLQESISNITRLSDNEVFCDVTIKATGNVHKETHIVFNNFDIEEGSEFSKVDILLSFPLEDYSGPHVFSMLDLGIISPTSHQIKQARLGVNLTQAEAADLIYKDERTWQRYEAGETTMHPAFFDLFKRKSVKYDDDIEVIKEAFASDHFQLYELDIMSVLGPKYQYRVSDNVWVTAYKENGTMPQGMKDDSAELLIHTLEIVEVDMNNYAAYVIETDKKGDDLQVYKGWQPLDLYKRFNTQMFANVPLSKDIDRS